ncbi:SGNH/GDSL hydrolase family protein [Actinoplanes sp. NPDC048796]|uniref:SGNH/GDSL hydrolase family protein n=1 Tax=unclassified Actinoplanes TaxID=2626549 RepID=UPI0034033FA3
MKSRLAGRLAGVVLAATVLAAGISGPAAADRLVAEPVRVMPLGDSITWGSGSADSRVGNRTGAATASGYRVDLRKRLTAAGMDVDFVGSRQAGPSGTDRDNEGHPGWRIDQIAAEVDGWLDTYRPDVVLLHIGTNDIAQNRPVDVSAAGLSALIDQIRAGRPGADIFVQRLVQGHAEPVKSRIAAYNRMIPGIVAGKDAKVHLVDQSSVGGLSLFDNLHPNDDGYAKMAYNLYRAMARVYSGGGAWPAGRNPYTATARTLCFQINRTVAGRRTWHPDCRTWTLRTVWQRPGTTVRTYRVKVKGHYVTRTRVVATWLSDDPYLTSVRAGGVR